MSGFACLYDRNFNPLGKWTQHVASEWTLTRKAYEFDEMTVTCRGFENSRKACFVGLHEETGKLKYVAFCGIPTTKENLTTVKGVDCRQIFNQTILLDFTQKASSGAYAIRTVEGLYTYLLKDCLAGMNLGIDYDIDVKEAELVEWEEDLLARTKKVQSLYDVIQAANNAYDLVVVPGAKVDSEANRYRLTFTVKRIYNERNIKLSDYDVRMTLNQNLVNRTVARSESGSTQAYYLYSDNTVGTAYDADRCLYPPRIETIEKEDFEEAKAEAMQALLDNRYKDKATIDLNTKLGSTLRDVDFTYFLNVSEYNPADPDTAKRLPVFSIKEDSKGNKTLSLGRLSDYWFME